jgi:Rha family phage regulatory protein
MKLVFIENNRPVTDSLMVAEVFDKDHKRVLQDVRELGCSAEFNQHNFVLIDYRDARNRLQKKYLMTEQGFTMLVMGYTGNRAMEFKEEYITEFHNMREQMKNNVTPLDERTVRLALLKTAHDHEERLEVTEKSLLQINQKVEEIDRKVEEQITLESGDQRKVQKSIARRIYELERDPEVRSEFFRQLHREIRDRWAVPSYKDVRRNELQQLLKYIDAWMPRKVA